MAHTKAILTFGGIFLSFALASVFIIRSKESRADKVVEACIADFNQCDSSNIQISRLDKLRKEKINNQVEKFNLKKDALECIEKQGYSFKCDQIDRNLLISIDKELHEEIASLSTKKKVADAARQVNIRENQEAQKTPYYGKSNSSGNAIPLTYFKCQQSGLDIGMDCKTQSVANIIVSVACSAQHGVIPRSSMGARIKELLMARGLSPEEIYRNMDFYMRNAKLYQSIAGVSCIQ
jgi:hypothetical protein